MEETKSFEDLGKAQKALIQAVLDALRDNRDAFETVAELQSNNIEDLVKLEHERTRGDVAAGAQATKDVVKLEHQASRQLNVNEHEHTRSLVERGETHTVPTIAAAQDSIEDHVNKASASQSLSMQSSLASAQDYLDRKMSSRIEESTQILTDSSNIANFMTDLRIADSDRHVIDSISQQLALA